MPFNTQPPYNVTMQQEVTATRALNTWYTNDTGRTMFYIVSVRCSAPAAGDYVLISPEVPGATQGQAGLNNTTGTQRSVDIVVTGIARPGESYRVTAVQNATGAFTLLRWLEAR